MTRREKCLRFLMTRFQLWRQEEQSKRLFFVVRWVSVSWSLLRIDLSCLHRHWILALALTLCENQEATLQPLMSSLMGWTLDPLHHSSNRIKITSMQWNHSKTLKRLRSKCCTRSRFVRSFWADVPSRGSIMRWSLWSAIEEMEQSR